LGSDWEWFFWLLTVTAIIGAVYLICSYVIEGEVKNEKRKSHATGYEQGIKEGCGQAYYQPDSKVNYNQCVEKATLFGQLWGY
jgi:hypothetical protein